MRETETEWLNVGCGSSHSRGKRRQKLEKFVFTFRGTDPGVERSGKFPKQKRRRVQQSAPEPGSRPREQQVLDR